MHRRKKLQKQNNFNYFELYLCFSYLHLDYSWSSYIYIIFELNSKYFVAFDTALVIKIQSLHMWDDTDQRNPFKNIAMKNKIIAIFIAQFFWTICILLKLNMFRTFRILGRCRGIIPCYKNPLYLLFFYET